VLVVDDDEDLRKLVAPLVRTTGHPVAEAGTGAEALEIARRRGAALVLLDVNLPDISGYEVCRKLREAFGERLPILFLSGVRTESFDRVGGLLLGADDYVVKPFAPDELLARMRRLLVRSATSGAAQDYELTRREHEVLGLLAASHTQARIAEELVITETTIATHIQHILGKVGVHSRAEAVAFAHRHGIGGQPG
jgi:DNA-binding response OmpR family regulator